jgi:hypothetical protein
MRYQMSQILESGAARFGRWSLRWMRKDFGEKGYEGYYVGVSEQPVGFRIFIPALGEEIVTVHCIFDENIPSRDEEYFKEIDEIFKIRVSPKERKAEDFYYLT